MSNNLIDSLINGTTALANGELVRVSSNNIASRAQANATANLVGFFGAVQTASSIANGGRAPVLISGVGQVLLEAGLTPVAGDTIFVSASVAGRGTTVAPSANAMAIGVVQSNALYASRSIVLASIGGPVLANGTSTTANAFATWGLSVNRYYAVDYVNGLDTNLGYSDVSMAAAGAVAVKTLTQLIAILPSFGQGRRVVVGIRGPTGNTASAISYLKPDGVTLDDLDMRGISGYRYMLVRTTQDFTNSASDKIVCAPVLGQTGPNGDGSWTVAGGATVNTFSVAAGTLNAKPGIYAMRVRFTGNVTAALANITRNVWKNTSSQIIAGIDLGVAPAAGDTFYIERPGVIIDQFYSPNEVAGGNGTGFDSTFVSNFVGFRASQTTNVTNFINGPGLTFTGSFLEFDSRLSCGVVQAFRTAESYVDEAAATITTGVGLRWTQNVSGSIVTGTCATQFNIGASALIGGSATSCTVQRPLGTAALFVASYNCRDLNIQGSRPSGGHGVNVGNLGTATQRRAYFDNAYVGPGQSSGVEIRGLDTNNCTGKPCIRFQSTVHGSLQFYDDIVSTDGGNTDVVLDVSGYTFNKLMLATRAAITATASLGDIRTANGTLITFAAVAADQYVDTNLNVYIGAAGTRVTRRTPGIFYNVPILGADPASPLDGDTWITNIAGTRRFCARIGGVTYTVVLT